VPTATLGWLLVVVLGLRPEQRQRASLLRMPVEVGRFSAGVRPPVGDRASYRPADAYLREGSRPWEE
jgi:hypothetical protein